MIEKPAVSKNFTIDDIHKIREYHYNLTKNMPQKERADFYNEGGRTFLAKMSEQKKAKRQKTHSIAKRGAKEKVALKASLKN